MASYGELWQSLNTHVLIELAKQGHSEIHFSVRHTWKCLLGNTPINEPPLSYHYLRPGPTCIDRRTTHIHIATNINYAKAKQKRKMFFF